MVVKQRAPNALKFAECARHGARSTQFKFQTIPTNTAKVIHQTVPSFHTSIQIQAYITTQDRRNEDRICLRVPKLLSLKPEG